MVNIKISGESKTILYKHLYYKYYFFYLLLSVFVRRRLLFFGLKFSFIAWNTEPISTKFGMHGWREVVKIVKFMSPGVGAKTIKFDAIFKKSSILLEIKQSNYWHD